MLGLFLIVPSNMLKNIRWWAYIGTKTWKMARSSTYFLFSKNLEGILSLTGSYSFDKSPKSAPMITETSSEMQC